MIVRDVNAMILARNTPVLMKHNVLLTFIVIHKQARQSSEESVDQVSYHSEHCWLHVFHIWMVLRSCVIYGCFNYKFIVYLMMLFL
jgi:hypothetical protein